MEVRGSRQKGGCKSAAEGSTSRAGRGVSGGRSHRPVWSSWCAEAWWWATGRAGKWCRIPSPENMSRKYTYLMQIILYILHPMHALYHIFVVIVILSNNIIYYIILLLSCYTNNTKYHLLITGKSFRCARTAAWSWSESMPAFTVA